MNILWLSWKDSAHPLAGGAEVVATEITKRLLADGHSVTFLVGGFREGEPETTLQSGDKSARIIRVGNRFNVYWKASRYYKKHLIGWADLVIDEMNTIPFFAKYYVHEPNILFVHQLCREIWFHELPPFLGWIGYALEPLYVRMLRDRQTITVSESTKQDLVRYGFNPENIQIISEGSEITPITSLSRVQKYDQPTVLSLGAIRSMKRTDHQIKAFEIAKKTLPNLHLKIAGNSSGAYGKKILHRIKSSPYRDSIEYLGRVSSEEKIDLMQRAHAILVTSVKEGWGLIVTEAGTQGTPAIVYNVHGLRDSVRYGEAGMIVRTNTPQELSEAILTVLGDQKLYHRLQTNAWLFSKGITFEQSYHDFKKATGVI